MPPASLYPPIPVIYRMIGPSIGEYRLQPQFALVVSLENGSLQVQPTNHPKFPLFAEARDKFFLQAVDAQIEFRRDSAGAVTGLTLFQNGNALPGTRVRR